MWLFTTRGFFSIVEHKDDKNYLLVRARVKGDIEKCFPGADVQRTEDADYLYRAAIPRAQVMAVVLDIVRKLDYPSFKGAIEDKGRYWSYYIDVNARMQEMQDDYGT